MIFQWNHTADYICTSMFSGRVLFSKPACPYSGTTISFRRDTSLAYCLFKRLENYKAFDRTTNVYKLQHSRNHCKCFKRIPVSSHIDFILILVKPYPTQHFSINFMLQLTKSWIINCVGTCLDWVNWTAIQICWHVFINKNCSWL